MSEPRKPSRPKGSGGARKSGTGRSGAGGAKRAGSASSHGKSSSRDSGTGRSAGGHGGGGRGGSARFEAKGRSHDKGKSDDYRGGKSRSTKSEHAGGSRSGGSKSRSSGAASRSGGGHRDSSGAHSGRTGGADGAKGASTGGEWRGRSQGATRGRSTERSRRASAGGSHRDARSNTGRGGPNTGRARDGHSGAPPARRGPRDPLIEEIRAATPKAKQEAAIAEFEHARDLLQRGRDGAAADAAADAKRLAPRSGAVRELYGVALYRAGRYRDALRELQAYRRMSGRLDQNHLIADSYRGLGMPDKAVPVAVEAVRSRMRDEPRAEAAIVGASALADLGRFDEAIGLLRGFPGRRDEAEPWELRVWYVAGDVLARSGRPSEAAEEFRRIVRYDAGAFDAAERLAALTV